MDDTRTCHCCPVLRPKGEPRLPYRPAVCDGCRSHLHTLLAELVNLYRLLPDIYGIHRDIRTGEKTVAEQPVAVLRDPVAASLPTRALSGSSNEHRVSGSKEPPAPADLDVADLTGFARVINLTTDGRRHPEDNVGHLPAVSILDRWVRDWMRHRCRGESSRPVPTTAALAGWLDARLAEACTDHPDIAAFAADLADLVRALRTAARQTSPPVERERYKGTPCPGCDLRKLFRRAGSDYIECGDCAKLQTPLEYEQWAELLNTKEYLPWVQGLAETERLENQEVGEEAAAGGVSRPPS